MAEEPRQEAERIVFQVGSGRKQAQRFHESEGEFLRRRNALVDVLAAAIKYSDARKRGNPSIATEHAAMDLDDALSALRGNHDG